MPIHAASDELRIGYTGAHPDPSQAEGRSSSRVTAVALIVSFAVTLTTAKGIKIAGAVGPGELLLGGYFIFAMLQQRSRPEWRLQGVVYLFWYVLAIALLAGYLVRTNTPGVLDPFPRTLFAYALIVGVLIAFFRAGDLRRNPVPFGIAYAAILAAVGLVASALVISGFRYAGPVSLFWHGTNRFQGWSLDPNQFAIAFIAGPFIAANVAGAMKLRAQSWMLLLAPMLAVPVITQSDALVLAWGCGTLYLLIQLAFSKSPQIAAPNAMRASALVLLTGGLLFLVLNFDSARQAVSDFLSRDGQAEGRLEIWRESVRIMGQSPLVGFGPDAGRDLGGNVGEAHNNFLFLGESAGLIGALSLAALFVYVWVRVRSAGDAFLSGGVLSLVVFGLAHSTLRHPAYWFAIILVDALALRKVENRTRYGAATEGGGQDDRGK